MIKILPILILLSLPVHAYQIEHADKFYECDEEYRGKDFTGQSLVDRDIKPGTIICRSCFSNETPDTHIFPERMTGVKFVGGNCDNVFIPDGNEVLGCTQRRFKVQNDLRDWKIDEQGRPVEVLGKDYWESKGIAIDPREIPDDKIILRKGEDLEEVLKVRMRE
jgi:hypothetical protein